MKTEYEKNYTKNLERMMAMILLQSIFILGCFNGCSSSEKFSKEKNDSQKYGNLMIINKTSETIFLDQRLLNNCSYIIAYGDTKTLEKKFYFSFPPAYSDIAIIPNEFSLSLAPEKNLKSHFRQNEDFNKEFYEITVDENLKELREEFISSTENIKYCLWGSKKQFAYHNLTDYTDNIKKWGIYANGYEDENGDILFIFTDDPRDCEVLSVNSVGCGKKN